MTQAQNHQLLIEATMVFGAYRKALERAASDAIAEEYDGEELPENLEALEFPDRSRLFRRQSDGEWITGYVA